MKKITKKVIAILLAFTFMVSFQVNVSAVTTPEGKLNDLGLLLNISEEELDATLTRDIGLTMILKSLGYTQADADAAILATPFTDVTGWATGWAALAYKLNITTGISDTIFNPKGILTEKEFVTFWLRALEYDENQAWENTVNLGLLAGLIVSGDDLEDQVYTKREAAIIMFKALSSDMQISKIQLIEQLVNKKVVDESKALAYNLIDTTFKVKSIVKDNLKVIQIEFTKSIDKETLTNDIVKVLKDDVAVMFDSNILDGVGAYRYALDLIDDKTVNIIFGTANLQEDIIELKIDGLLSTSGKSIDGYAIDLKLKDNQVPYVIEVVAPNPKMIQVTYNEPVQFKTGSKVFTDVFLDDLRLAGTATLNHDRQVLSFELTELMDPGNHKFFIEGTTDYAGLVGVDKTTMFNVVADNDMPYILNVYAPNRNEVVVEFDEIINETKGYIKIANRTYNLTDTAKVTVEDKKVYIELDVSLTASSAFTPILGSYKNIEDFIGNKVGSEIAFTFLAEFDNELPTLTAEVSTSNEIVVTFSEPVESFDNNNFAIKDDEENLIGIGFVGASGSSKTIYKITLSNPIIDKNIYTLLVKGVKDLSVIQNRLEDTEVELQMFDLNRPEIEAVRLVDDETARITYSESMNQVLIANADNYMFKDVSTGTTLPLSALSNYTIAISSDNDYVDIHVPDMVSGDYISVFGVKDESGMLLKESGKNWSIAAANDFTGIDLTARLIDTKTIELVATNHEFDIVFANDFIVRTSTGDSLYHYISSASIDPDDASIAYLTLNAKLDSDAKYNGKTQYLYLEDEVVTQDIYNQKLEILYTSPLKINDYVTPKAEIDLGTSDTIIIEFSEVVGADTDSKVVNDILLKDKNGDYVTLIVGGNFNYEGGNSTHSFFDVIEITGLNGGESYSLEIVSRYIQDDKDNSVTKVDQVTFEVKE